MSSVRPSCVLLVALLAAATLIACGGGGKDDDGVEHARKFLDPRSDLVAVVDLDYGGAQWDEVKRLYARAAREGLVSEVIGFDLAPPTMDGALGLLGLGLGVSFDKDVRPLLDGKLLVGVRAAPEPEVTLAFRAGDREALERVLRKLGDEGLEPKPLRGIADAKLLTEGLALVGGDTLVAVLGGGDPEPLLRSHLRGEGLPAASLPRDEGDDALVRVRARPGLLGAVLRRDALGRVLATRPGRALRGAHAALRLHDDRATVDARVDFEGLSGDELPLPGPSRVELPDGRGIASASADQQRTTVFAARIMRAAFPDSRFVRRVEALERRIGVRFEDEVLRQFSGPSVSLLRPRPDGTTRFAARSTLRDAEAMRRLLPRLTPALPGILESLEALGATGLTGLLLVAPDAPLTPASIFALAGGVDVEPIEDEQARRARAQLYEINGLARRGVLPVQAADTVVYGVIGDQFVVASDRRLAEGIARLSTKPASPAGTRLRVDVAALAGELGNDGAWLRRLARILPTVEAWASGQGGDVVARAEARLR